MNVQAIKSMEDFAKQVLMFNAEKQDEFFESLRGTCLTESDINELKKCVTAYNMMTDSNFYKAVQKALAEQLWNEFNS